MRFSLAGLIAASPRPSPPLLIGVGTGLIALGYGAAFVPVLARTAAPWLMVAGLVVLLPSVFWLGIRRGKARPAWIGAAAIVLVALALGTGFGLGLILAPEAPGSGLFLGLPRRAALILYVIGALPAAVLPVLYAWAFSSPRR